MDVMVAAWAMQSQEDADLLFVGPGPGSGKLESKPKIACQRYPSMLKRYAVSVSLIWIKDTFQCL